ncbi:MAG: hypothetical protein KGO96_13155 [Elusimicrobia bacterium]|nr:hypothetical protein [Elusimicrobiota bacterium]MDE2426842.1 hypothetical protein [Elusimicrobiota bacterium]
MPVEGWKSITIREDVCEALEKRAKAQNRSVSNLADTILRKELELEVPA